MLSDRRRTLRGDVGHLSRVTANGPGDRPWRTYGCFVCLQQLRNLVMPCQPLLDPMPSDHPHDAAALGIVQQPAQLHSEIRDIVGAGIG